MIENDVFIQKELKRLSPEEVKNINTDKILDSVDKMIQENISDKGTIGYHHIGISMNGASVEITTPMNQMTFTDFLTQAFYCLGFATDEKIRAFVLDEIKEHLESNTDKKM